MLPEARSPGTSAIRTRTAHSPESSGQKRAVVSEGKRKLIFQVIIRTWFTVSIPDSKSASGTGVEREAERDEQL